MTIIPCTGFELKFFFVIINHALVVHRTLRYRIHLRTVDPVLVCPITVKDL